MQLKETKRALQIFAKNVVKVSRSNLTKDKKNVSKELYDSIQYDLKVEKNKFSLSFFMEDYGMFQDKGVKGAGQVRKTTSKYKRTNNKGKMWKQNAKNSPFSYKKNGKKPPASAFKKWADAHNVSPFAVAYSVWAQGIKPSLFFTKPFEKHFKNLPKDLVKRFALDLENIITK
jgi:hypothetical protein